MVVGVSQASLSCESESERESMDTMDPQRKIPGYQGYIPGKNNHVIGKRYTEAAARAMDCTAELRRKGKAKNIRKSSSYRTIVTIIITITSLILILILILTIITIITIINMVTITITGNPNGMVELVDDRPQGRNFLYAQTAHSKQDDDDGPQLCQLHVGRRR